MMVVSSNHRGTGCGPKSPGGSMSERDSGTQAMSRMRNGADRASYAGGQAFGSAARHRVARRGGRDLVYRADRLSVADAAEGLSSVHDGARLFLRLARQRPV